MTPYERSEHEAREYHEKKERDALEGAAILVLLFCTIVIMGLLNFLVSGWVR